MYKLSTQIQCKTLTSKPPLPQINARKLQKDVEDGMMPKTPICFDSKLSWFNMKPPLSG